MHSRHEALSALRSSIVSRGLVVVDCNFSSAYFTVYTSLQCRFGEISTQTAVTEQYPWAAK